MPNDLSVKAVSPVNGSSQNPSEPKPQPAPPAAHAPAASAGPPIVNPTLTLDAALGLVVLEFRDDTGKVTTSIPTQQQLEAYRHQSESPSGQAGRSGQIHTSTTKKA